MTTRRPTLVGVLLGGALLLTGVLALQAWRAMSQRRSVVDRALRDYASFAAAELGRRARDRLMQATMFGALRPALSVDAASARPPAPVTILEAAPARRPAVDLRPAVQTWFRLVLRDGSLTTARTAPSPALAAWLRDSIPVQARDRRRDNMYYGLAAAEPDGAPLVVGFASRYGADGDVALVYGYVLAARDLAPVFSALLRGEPLLPRATAPIDNDEALVVSVRAAGGAPVFANGVIHEPAAVESLGVAFAGLVARVATRPEAAGSFVIGGIPDAPLLPLAGVFVLAAILLVLAMRQWRREAELVRLREDFVAGVSHELRTPLAQIRLFAETLQLGRLRGDAERARALGIVHDEARRLSHLVENLLQFSRAGRRGAALAAEAVPLGELVQDVLTAFAPLAAPHGVRLRPTGAPAVAIADRDALRQVLINLLDNAVKYGPAGQTITVETAMRDGRAVLAVGDEGPGIAPADRERIFERFTRLAPGRTLTGAGLGLAVVRELVERLDGTVRVEATPRGGARFVIELPAGGAP